MGNFEKLSVLVIVVIIVMILVVALYTWTDKPSDTVQADAGSGDTSTSDTRLAVGDRGEFESDLPADPWDPPASDSGALGSGEEVDLGDVGDGTTTTDEDGTGDLAEDERDDVERGDVEDDVTTESDDPTVVEEWVYSVKNGDTIGHIAMRELGTIRRQGEIYDMNPGLDALRLQIDQKLRMPARGTTSSTRAGGDATTSGGATSGGGTMPVPGSDYVTRHGDQLRTIAKRAYGDWERWPEIFAKNFGVIDNPERVPPGVKIFIPK